MPAAWTGDLARLAAGASPSDGQGGWTLPPERRLRYIAERRARVQAEEGAALAATIEQEVRRALLELEARVAAEPATRVGRAQPLPDGLVERAWQMYEGGLSTRAVAERLLGETGYRSAGGFRNRLDQEFEDRGMERRPRAVTRITHGAYAGLDREKMAAHRRKVRADRAIYCSGNDSRGKPCERRVAEGVKWCWSHDPANADVVAQHAQHMRAFAARAGNQRGGPDGSRNHNAGHDDERQGKALARAGGGARRAAA